MNPVGAFVYIQCWQLLCLCVTTFLPKLKILWLLKSHLRRHADERLVTHFVHFVSVDIKKIQIGLLLDLHRGVLNLLRMMAYILYIQY